MVSILIYLLAVVIFAACVVRLLGNRNIHRARMFTAAFTRNCEQGIRVVSNELKSKCAARGLPTALSQFDETIGT